MMEDDQDKQITDNTPMLWRSELGQSASGTNEEQAHRPQGSIFNKDMLIDHTPKLMVADAVRQP